MNPESHSGSQKLHNIVSRKRKQKSAESKRPPTSGSQTTGSEGRKVPSKDSRSKNPRKEGSTATGTCDHVANRYEKVGRVGEGTYGVVYKARDKRSGGFVALKRCIPHHESSDGFPLTTIRELHALRLCGHHPNVVRLQNVAVSSSNGVFLVFEFCSQDIAQILDAYYAKHRCSPFDVSHVKTLTMQLLSALQFCHDRALLHRDIKPSNLLYNEAGQLKLADFGLSRHTAEHLTANVVSLWYRAPELLMQKGFTKYTTAIDIWATGCVVAELLQGFPLLDGRNELEQVDKMVACLGKPPFQGFQEREARTTHVKSGSRHQELWDRFSFMTNEGLALLTKLLEYQSEKRWTAGEAIQCTFFMEEPVPSTAMPFLKR
eukprot:Nitzschia sp. Nitz4//scaffold226_size53432//52593//53717//NITZ4_006709-RA/size53432-processed-gene-0.36-mRNA-1//-1//CDS//3329542775//508//frame0